MCELTAFESSRIIFPGAPSALTVSQFRAAIDGINNAYELAAIELLPGYEAYPITRRLAPRKHSRLIAEDELRISSLTYGSPLELLLTGDNVAVGVVLGSLAWVGRELVKDGARNTVELFNLRASIKTRKASLKAEESDHRLRELRNMKSLEARFNSGDRGGEEEVASQAGIVHYARHSELPTDTAALTDRLVARELSNVARVIGPADVSLY